ncbi:hypothetical protein [Superficieibacter sp. 1612_C1]|uniref:hypothetical protein n=1 Tax=Superficieibacter sp. 1612_C1 TaxID=2780382 RepID=UPI0018838425|nr:hypothetical protein [Superficieibacter sp. 1612_C1]
MTKSEPKIIANGFTDEELCKWMEEKLRSVRFLRSALQEKQELLEALAEVDARIKNLECAASMEYGC